MSQSKSKRIRVKIVNPLPGQKPHCSLERAWRYIRDRAAEWVDATCSVLRMLCRPAPAAAVAPKEDRRAFDPIKQPTIVHGDKLPWERDLSGNFLRYPPRSQVTGESYPALARIGAGLL